MLRELKPDYAEPGEDEVFKEMIKLTLDEMKRTGERLRGQHAKATGCVHAEFRIADNIRPDLRYGVFRDPGRTYRAIVRFSNRQGPSEKDGEPQARGLAIKLLDVEGERTREGYGGNTQDFLMVNYPVFPFPNPRDYVRFMTIKDIPWDKDILVAGYLGLVRRDEGKIANAIRSQHVASPLEINYWSGSPYWLGTAAGEPGHAVKYSAVSLQAERSPEPDQPEDLSGNYLSQALASDLTQQAFFEFKVQVQTDPVAMPIENVSVEWDERVSKPVPMAMLRIPPQKVDPEGDLAKRCERMSFNPWHALAEHRPVGGMNRLRLAVYEASFSKRALEHPGG